MRNIAMHDREHSRRLSAAPTPPAEGELSSSYDKSHNILAVSGDPRMSSVCDRCGTHDGNEIGEAILRQPCRRGAGKDASGNDLVSQFRAQSPEHDRLYREERARVDAAEALAALDEMIVTQDEEQRAEAYHEVRCYLEQCWANASSNVPETWRPIESAPSEEGVYHARGFWVYDASSEKPLYFDVRVGYLRNGAFVSNNGDDVHGWDPDDYTHWVPLPEPPAATAAQRGGNGDA